MMQRLNRSQAAARWTVRTLPLLVLIASLAGPSSAEDEEAALRIEPGQWRFKTVSKMPMSTQPQSRTTTQCIRENQRTAPQLTKVSSRGCKSSDAVVSGDTMKWRISCGSGSSKMTGEAEFRSTGTAIEGATAMNMEHGGMKLAFERTLSGERIGDCEPELPTNDE